MVFNIPSLAVTGSVGIAKADFSFALDTIKFSVNFLNRSLLNGKCKNDPPAAKSLTRATGTASDFNSLPTPPAIELTN